MVIRALKESLPGIILSFIVPALLGYFILPLPTNAVANAMASGIDGALSAALTSVITLVIFMKKISKRRGDIKMDRKELETQVLNMVAMSYKKDVNELTIATSFKEDLSGASVQMVALVSEIENELDVALMLADASACATVGDLINLIEEEM